MKTAAFLMMVLFMFQMAAVAVYAETIDIGGTTYHFMSDQLGADHALAEVHCQNMSMVIAGFETQAEWDAVMSYMQTNGKQSFYWTSGTPLTGATLWEWGHSGVTFDDKDIRWAGQEPGNGPWDSERVSLNVEDGLMYSDDMSLAHKIICEMMMK